MASPATFAGGLLRFLLTGITFTFLLAVPRSSFCGTSSNDLERPARRVIGRPLASPPACRLAIGAASRVHPPCLPLADVVLPRNARCPPSLHEQHAHRQAARSCRCDCWVCVRPSILYTPPAFIFRFARRYARQDSLLMFFSAGGLSCLLPSLAALAI